MGTIDWRERTHPVDGGLHEALVAKCQENGWLKRGGYDWQDDPWLEEYPYEFVEAEDVSALRGFFGHGNWAIRMNLPRFRLHPYAAVLAAPSICLASNSSGLRCPSAEWIRTRL